MAEESVSVTDVKHYVYCPRLVYFDRVLHVQTVFGSQQDEDKEQHEDYVLHEAGGWANALYMHRLKEQYKRKYEIIFKELTAKKYKRLDRSFGQP